MIKVNWREIHEKNKQKKRLKTERIALKAEKRAKIESEKQNVVSCDTIANEQNSVNGRQWTVSIALPASIVDNAQTHELKAYLCGQIARSAVIFNVDEIVIFDEFARPSGETNDNESLIYDNRKKSLVQMIRILQYLECPQYLRKFLFPIQNDLKYAGLLNPLDSHHHLKADDICNYREGIVTNKPIKDGKGSHVYVGLQKDIQIDKCLETNVRVTVKFDGNKFNEHRKVNGIAVSPSAPRTEAGLYWGYNIRIAKSLSRVFSETPFDGGYDLTIGTSDRGDNIDAMIKKIPKKFNHLLIVFGGLKGLEAALDSDESLAAIDDPRDLFRFYLNTCPGQGSNTIRTEEAILITLSALRKRLLKFKSS